MNNRQECEFTLTAKQNKAGEWASMYVRIVTDGDSVTITGTSGGEEYEGTLVLKKKKPGKAEGNECWVCQGLKPCVWTEPCPY